MSSCTNPATPCICSKKLKMFRRNKTRERRLKMNLNVNDRWQNVNDIWRNDNEQYSNGIPSSVGMFDVKTANQTIIEAKKRPDPEKLWKTLWYEGEVCCLFADSNVGKSIYAVQIATEIANRKKVLYFDFELSDKQFQLRYTDSNGNLFTFPDNLYRVSINSEKFDVTNFEDAIIQNIEKTALRTDAKVLIIDNLTYLCSSAEKSDLAGILMLRLMELKRKYSFSILVLAHTPKRDLTRPITQNDLAGCKKLYNFFDSVIAIGKSVKGSKMRYIKQLKVRYGEHKYDSDNVIVCTIEKVGAFLQFKEIEYGNDIGIRHEREHLKERSAENLEQEIENVKKLQNEGMTIRDIAKQLDMSKSKVARLQKK